MRSISSTSEGVSAMRKPSFGSAGKPAVLRASGHVGPARSASISGGLVRQDVGHQGVDLLVLGRLAEDELVAGLGELAGVQGVRPGDRAVVVRRRALVEIRDVTVQ